MFTLYAAVLNLVTITLLITFQLSSLPDLIPALTTAEQRAASSLKWRTHEKLLQKYACLPHIISSDQIYYRFLQRMFTIMMTNVSSEFPLMVLNLGIILSLPNSLPFQDTWTLVPVSLEGKHLHRSLRRGVKSPLLLWFTLCSSTISCREVWTQLHLHILFVHYQRSVVKLTSLFCAVFRSSAW